MSIAFHMRIFLLGGIKKFINKIIGSLAEDTAMRDKESEIVRWGDGKIEGKG